MPSSLLRVARLSKTFPGTRALRDVSLSVDPGEVHALVGANGSGKSTLVKVLAGFHEADPGAEVFFEGEPFDLADRGDGRHSEMRFVHQELGLVTELGVMDNLALQNSFARGRFGTINWREQAREAAELLSRFDLRLNLTKPLAQVTPVERVIVAIIAALQGWEGGTGLLVLDEPTAVLPPHEVGRLFEIVNEVRRSGTSILYVSHRLDEIFEIGDRVTVLRGGEVISTDPVADMTPRALASRMAGEDVEPDFRVTFAPPAEAELALDARGVTGRYLKGVDLRINKGEVVGLAGLPGSGRDELPYVLSGWSLGPVGGEIRTASAPDRWVRLGTGAAPNFPLVPADRGDEAVIEDFSVRENLTLPLLDQVQGRLGLSRSRELELVSTWEDKLKIRAAGPEVSIAKLSGGNQQKVVIARCLALNPDVLFLCEPTAGVDIATRVSIYELIADQANAGLAAVISSTDIGDLLAACNRVLVFRDGQQVGALQQEELSKSRLVHAMEGTDQS